MSAEKKLDPEQEGEITERKFALHKEHAEYLDSHTELRDLIHDFVVDILIRKPDDVIGYAQEYFEHLKPADIGREEEGPPPLVIVGPSGVGKGTLIQMLMDEFPSRFGFSVSHTTRGPRPGEIDGMHYHFTTREDMQVAVDEGKFVETALVHGNLYGTSYEAVRRVSASGKVCILDIDTQGAQSVKRSSLHAYYVFIAPPSMDELERRLRGRGTESEEKVQLRLGGAKMEMDFSQKTGFFDKIIVNDDRERAYEELKKVALGLSQ